jgi:hypothetical protein
LKKAVLSSFDNPYDKARWKQKLYFDKESIRVKRLALQTRALISAFSSASTLFVASRIEECQLREAINHGDFKGVDQLLLQEQSMKRMRRNRKIMDVLGEQFFKIRTLNLNAFILKDTSGAALEYIVGKQ